MMQHEQKAILAALKTPQTAWGLADALHLSKKQVNACLYGMRKKGLVSRSQDRPYLWSERVYKPSEPLPEAAIPASVPECKAIDSPLCELATSATPSPAAASFDAVWLLVDLNNRGDVWRQISAAKKLSKGGCPVFAFGYVSGKTPLTTQAVTIVPRGAHNIPLRMAWDISAAQGRLLIYIVSNAAHNYLTELGTEKGHTCLVINDLCSAKLDSLEKKEAS